MEALFIVFIIIVVILTIAIYLVPKWKAKNLREIKDFIARKEEENKRYLVMSTEELSKLDDDELIRGVLWRIEAKGKEYEVETVERDSYQFLNKQEQVTYIAYDFLDLAIEDEDAGLRTFLGGVMRDFSAPRLSESLAEIGAYEYKQVFDEFVYDNNIDLYDLSKFARCYENDFEKQAKIYSFENADARLKGLSGLNECIVKYIRENINVL